MVEGTPPVVRKALVIGAEQPAGGVIARGLAEGGADVALCALTADEAVMRARAVRRQIEALGHHAPEYIMDVTLGKNVQVTMRQIVKELGGLDVVVIAPDLPFAHPLSKTTDTDLARVMQTNFAAHFFAIRAAADEFRRLDQPGRILSVTSVLGARPIEGIGAYSAAHGAVQGLVRSAAAELAPSRVAVNALALPLAPWMAAGDTDVPSPAWSEAYRARLLGIALALLALDDGAPLRTGELIEVGEDTPTP